MDLSTLLWTRFYNILPDYTVPFLGNGVLSGTVAVILGTLLVFGIVTVIGRMVRRPRLG